MATKKYVSLEKLGLYDEKIKKFIADADAAALESAKDYTDESFGLANENAASLANTAETNAKAYADGKDAAIQAAHKAGTDAAAAAAIADDKAVATQGEVDALEAYVGTFTHDTAKTVVEYINAKTDGIATSGNLEALGTRVTTVEGKVATIEGDHLKAADKTELEGKITTAQDAAEAAQSAVEALADTHATDKKTLEDAIVLKADKTALDEISAVANAAVKQTDYDVKVKAFEDEDARIVGLVEAEAERAAGVESGLEERLVEVEAFFKLAEGEQLDTALDTLKEIQDYVTTEGTAADKMVEDIAANKKAIEDHIATDHDFAGADAALKAELEGKINGKVAQGDFDTLSGKVTTAEGKITTLEGEMDAVEGRATTLEGKMTAVEGAVATKVEQEAYNTKVAALEGEDTAIKGRLDVIEAQLGDGEGSVADMIADAKSELQGELATAVADAKTDASNKDAVVLAEAQKAATAVQTALDAHTDNADIHVTADDKAKWNAALQAADITVGTANGTIAVKGTDVAVKGLGSAAYAATTAFDAAGSAAQALTDAKTHADTLFAQFVEVSEEEINNLFA